MKHKRGFALGVFDLFHVGHLRYLEYAAASCNELWVGIRSDTILTPGKKQKPYFSEDDRHELVMGLACVTNATVFTTSLDNTKYWLSWFQNNNISLVVVGGDWKGSPRWQKLAPVLNKNGIEVIFAPRTKGISSSKIRLRLQKNP